MDIVIDVSCGNQQPSFQVFSDLGILLDIVFECDISLFVRDFFDSMMLLTPPPVIHVIFVVARRGDRHFEEVGIDQHGCCGHKTASGMTKDSNFIDVDERMSDRQLLDSGFFIRKSVIS